VLLAGRGISFFGGGGGITFLDELRAGATGLIPGVGFNERFVAAWEAWSAGDEDRARAYVAELQPLVNAVSGPGHEFSIHARKRLLVRAGLIPTAVVRRPSVTVDEDAMASVLATAEALGIRLLEGAAP
jgi:dihydrodipicolinate synthase/N-acetylneuraminate lyase